MDSLSSLTHNTHTHDTSTHVQNLNDNLDEADDDTEEAIIGADTTIREISDRATVNFNEEFDFQEFFELATRILNGESASMEQLNSLKERWKRIFQSPIDTDSKSAKLKPVAGRESNSIDAIADAFLQSSQKTLSYIPPSREKGKIIVRPSPATVEKGAQRWHSTAVGYFLGKKPYFPHVESYVRSNWKDLQQVSATSNGFYFFRFKNRVAMEDIIEGGPWLIQGQPIVLQCWEQGMSLRRQKHTQIPVWVRLKHLPMEYWMEEGLSAVASGIRVPLYIDKITRECSRLDFARVCVMLDYNSVIPKHVVVVSPMLREGKETPSRIVIEYEWLPQRCKTCCSLGHTSQTCPKNKKPEHVRPVTVFVKKHNMEQKKMDTEVQKMAGIQPPAPKADHLHQPKERCPTSSKGKDIILYNHFDLLTAASQDLEVTAEGDRINSGPIPSSPPLEDT
ncbi:UNVERIFIED_CONTAM: hypothetical protein Sangu_1707200 [Sesamum angustifolium]|uniref:DUF4283 domain-containing protein n=1 Tax=Sesamum angustifolium TaxID=2727405 RepID=A0AAW2MM99_9LAMI